MSDFLWNIHGVETLQNVDLNSAVVGDNTLIAADPLNEIFVQGLLLTTTLATVITIKFGATVVATIQLGALGSINLADITGMEGEPILRVPKNTALVIGNTASTNRVSGFVKWAVNGNQ